MQVIIDTEKGLSETDRAAVLVLLGIEVSPTGVVMAAAKFPTQAERHAAAAAHTPSPEGEAGIKRDTEAKPAKKAAKKTAASRKATSEATEAPAEPSAPAPAASEPEAAKNDAPDMGAVKVRVQKYLDANLRPVVVAAMDKVGSKRVGLIDPAKFQEFLDLIPLDADGNPVVPTDD